MKLHLLFAQVKGHVATEDDDFMPLGVFVTRKQAIDEREKMEAEYADTCNQSTLSFHTLPIPVNPKTEVSKSIMECWL